MERTTLFNRKSHSSTYKQGNLYIIIASINALVTCFGGFIIARTHHKNNRLLKYFYQKKGIWFHLVGLGCLIWFVVRVVPKPARSQYPCQQVSLSIAVSYLTFWCVLVSGFILWCKLIRVKAASLLPMAVAGCVVFCSVSGVVFAAGFVVSPLQAGSWDPAPNEPIGTGQGVHPGRVVWVWNPDATETSLTGYWWNEENNNQTVINAMVSAGIQMLAGETSDSSAWDVLFRFFNLKHSGHDSGYQPGEKIAIKINLNNCWELYLNPYTKKDNQLDANPYVVKALLAQLITKAGVAPQDIILFDASRCMANWFFDRVYPQFPEVCYVDAMGGAPHRVKVQPSDVVVHLADGTHRIRTLPTCVAEAKYLINIPLLKRHPINQGVTLSGKNFFGSCIEPVVDLHEYHMSAFTLGNPAPQTDFFAAEELGGKTLLYLGDGLYATKIDHRTISRFEMYPFNNDWTNSLFFSQDPVALDSVMFDFLFSEGTNPVEGSQNYLHQAACPPAGVYDPENDGVFLNHSLGVHEHWNPLVDIFSSDRYVGLAGHGIEYVAVNQNQMTPSVSIMVPQRKYVYLCGVERCPFPFTLVIGTIMVQAKVVGGSGGVEKVEFYLNSNHVHTDTEAPYSWAWMSRHFFRCHVSVRAYLGEDEILTDAITVWRLF